MRSDNIEALISDFIYRYGERGRAVLEAIIRASQKLSRGAVAPLPGDFDYRSVVEELGVMGYSYNPSPLLRILEKEYSLVRTTLHTSGQRWYVLSNREAIEEYVERLRSGGEEDPEYLVVRLQLDALRLDEVARTLKSLANKRRWSDADYRRLYDISFRRMPKLLRIYRKIQEDPERWGSYIRDIEEVFTLARRLRSRASALASPEEPGEHFKSIGSVEAGGKGQGQVVGGGDVG